MQTDDSKSFWSLIMIFESGPWKEDLSAYYGNIIEYSSSNYFQNDDDNSDNAYSILEKSIFYSAFVIRKLVDCKTKLSDEADCYALKIEIFESKKHFDNMHRWTTEDSHNWGLSKKQTKQGKDVCKWLIHSLIFELIYNKDQSVEGFCVASDFDSDKCLYHVTLKDWLSYIDFVRSDDISEFCTERTERGVKYKKSYEIKI
jgi:hypothetical protein